jgi:hypothetical protein
MRWGSLLLRSAIAVKQLFLVRNSANDLVWSQIAELRKCRCPPLTVTSEQTFSNTIYRDTVVDNECFFTYLSTFENLLLSNTIQYLYIKFIIGPGSVHTFCTQCCVLSTWRIPSQEFHTSFLWLDYKWMYLEDLANKISSGETFPLAEVTGVRTYFI